MSYDIWFVNYDKQAKKQNPIRYFSKYKSQFFAFVSRLKLEIKTSKIPSKTLLLKQTVNEIAFEGYIEGMGRANSFVAGFFDSTNYSVFDGFYAIYAGYVISNDDKQFYLLPAKRYYSKESKILLFLIN